MQLKRLSIAALAVVGLLTTGVAAAGQSVITFQGGSTTFRDADGIFGGDKFFFAPISVSFTFESGVGPDLQGVGAFNPILSATVLFNGHSETYVAADYPNDTMPGNFDGPNWGHLSYESISNRIFVTFRGGRLVDPGNSNLFEALGFGVSMVAAVPVPFGWTENFASAEANSGMLSTGGFDRTLTDTNDSFTDFRQYSQWAPSYVTVVAIPEPETYAMLLAGLGLLGFVARRRRSDSPKSAQ